MSQLRTLCLALAIFSAQGAYAAEPSALQRGKDFYRALEFEKCVKTLEAAQSTLTAAQDLVDRELYLGLCEAALTHVRQASRAFETALELDPTARLPAHSSPKVEALFELAKKRTGQNAAPPREPVVPPQSATVTSPATATIPALTEQPPAQPTTSPRGSGVPTWIPWTVGGLGVAGLATFVGLGLAAKDAESRANSLQTFPDESARLGVVAGQRAIGANVALGAGIAALAGLVVVLVVSHAEGSTE